MAEARSPVETHRHACKDCHSLHGDPERNRDGEPNADLDGDGNRVLETVNDAHEVASLITAVHIGDHYEVEGIIVRKHCSAAGKRVALRKDGAP